MFPWQKSSKSDARRNPRLSQGGSSGPQHSSRAAVLVAGLRYSQRLQPLPDSLKDRLEPVQW